jgi:hypothetical protein
VLTSVRGRRIVRAPPIGGSGPETGSPSVGQKEFVMLIELGSVSEKTRVCTLTSPIADGVASKSQWYFKTVGGVRRYCAQPVNPGPNGWTLITAANIGFCPTGASLFDCDHT